MEDHTLCAIENQQGFTLVETMIALMVLTVGILSVNAMQVAAINTNIRANRVTQSTSWAAQQLEILMELDYDDPLLVDRNNNSVGQDANANGLDDDDEIGIPIDGILNFGLDETGANADRIRTSPDRLFIVNWNVADDKPMIGSKTINVIVTRPKEGRTRNTVITFIKTADEKAKGSV